MTGQADMILDIEPGDTPAEMDPIPAPELEPEPHPELLTALHGFMERLVTRDDEMHELLGEIRVALDALVSRLPVPAEDSPAPVASPQLDYAEVIDRTRACVAEAVPVGATVAVINKGDKALLRHERRAAQHYPLSADGSYAGFYPNDSTGAIAQLERTRENGVEFLVIPASAFWWLEHYAGLRRHLDMRYKLTLRRDDACVIYDLREGHRAPVVSVAKQSAQTLTARIRAYLATLLPAKAHLAIVSKGDPELLAMKRFNPVHFPRQEDGEWTGYHPADSAACIAHLDELIADGVRWLVIPRPQVWYLDHYADFTAHLDTHHRLVARQQQLCVVYALNPPSL